LTSFFPPLPFALGVGVVVIVDRQILYGDEGNLNDETLLVEGAAAVDLAAENMLMSRRIYEEKHGV
jgi:hypothetical protein